MWLRCEVGSQPATCRFDALGLPWASRQICSNNDHGRAAQLHVPPQPGLSRDEGSLLASQVPRCECGQPARRARQLPSLARHSRPPCQSRPRKCRVAARPGHEPQPRGDSPGGAEGAWKSARNLAAGRAMIARLKERSPDNAMLSKDLAWCDVQIAEASKRAAK